MCQSITFNLPCCYDEKGLERWPYLINCVLSWRGPSLWLPSVDATFLVVIGTWLGKDNPTFYILCACKLLGRHSFYKEIVNTPFRLLFLFFQTYPSRLFYIENCGILCKPSLAKTTKGFIKNDIFPKVIDPLQLHLTNFEIVKHLLPTDEERSHGVM